MSGKQKKIIFMVALWAATFAASFFLSGQIEGPRNIDTGFRRLNVLFIWQLVALCIAIVTAIAAFFPRGGGRSQKIIGLIPIGATLLLVAGLAVVSIYLNREREAGIRAQSAPATTAPVADAIEIQD